MVSGLNRDAQQPELDPQSPKLDSFDKLPSSKAEGLSDSSHTAQDKIQDGADVECPACLHDTTGHPPSTAPVEPSGDRWASSRASRRESCSSKSSTINRLGST